MHFCVPPIKIFEKCNCFHAALRQIRRFFSNHPVDTIRFIRSHRSRDTHQKDDHRAMRPTHSITTTGITATAASNEAAFAVTSATGGASIIQTSGTSIYSGQESSQKLAQLVAYSEV
ncbi:MAG: hypothetical protein LBK99_22500, partial [Opitutaceae bacterium]|nr:hypothetical protein [Opitutaceae bacterium]